MTVDQLPDPGISDAALAEVALWDLVRWRRRFFELMVEATLEFGGAHPVARKAAATHRRFVQEVEVRAAQVWPQ